MHTIPRRKRNRIKREKALRENFDGFHKMIQKELEVKFQKPNFLRLRKNRSHPEPLSKVMPLRGKLGALIKTKKILHGLAHEGVRALNKKMKRKEISLGIEEGYASSFELEAILGLETTPETKDMLLERFFISNDYRNFSVDQYGFIGNSIAKYIYRVAERSPQKRAKIRKELRAKIRKELVTLDFKGPLNAIKHIKDNYANK